MRFAPTPDQIELAGAVRELLDDACRPRSCARPGVPTGTRRGRRSGGSWPTWGCSVRCCPRTTAGWASPRWTWCRCSSRSAGPPCRCPSPRPSPSWCRCWRRTARRISPALVAGDLVGTAELDGGGILPWAGCSDRALIRTGGELRLVDLTGLAAEPVVTVDGSRAAARVPEAAGTVVSQRPAVLERAWLRGGAGRLRPTDRPRPAAARPDRRRTSASAGSSACRSAASRRSSTSSPTPARPEFAAPVVQRPPSRWPRSPRGPGRTSTAKAMASDAGPARRPQRPPGHGAIGYTVEYDLHLYVKRAWALAATGGASRTIAPSSPRRWGCHPPSIRPHCPGEPPMTEPSRRPVLYEVADGSPT